LDEDTNATSILEKSRNLDEIKRDIAEIAGVRGRSFVPKDINGTEEAKAMNEKF
jgi:hypothetical protein